MLLIMLMKGSHAFYFPALICVKKRVWAASFLCLFLEKLHAYMCPCWREGGETLRFDSCLSFFSPTPKKLHKWIRNCMSPIKLAFPPDNSGRWKRLIVSGLLSVGWFSLERLQNYPILYSFTLSDSIYICKLPCMVNIQHHLREL